MQSETYFDTIPTEISFEIIKFIEHFDDYFRLIISISKLLQILNESEITRRQLIYHLWPTISNDLLNNLTIDHTSIS